jgi:hypothetical protein
VLAADKQRLVKPQPINQPFYSECLEKWVESRREIDGQMYEIKCPYQVGDTLWVRETWDDVLYGKVIYRADYEPYKCFAGEFPKGRPERWKPSLFMPRWASRLSLRVTNVRVEHLQDILDQEDGAMLEGFKECAQCGGTMFYEGGGDIQDCSCGAGDRLTCVPTREFIAVWDARYAKRGLGFDANPWVWVIEFERATAGKVSER